MTTYACAECGAPVECKDAEVGVEFIRSCEHLEAAIHANMEAVCYGAGTTETGAGYNPPPEV